MKCEDCGADMTAMYRFTDWYYDNNDSVGNYQKCLQLFKKAIEDEPDGRFSIYDISYCTSCENIHDEGILFNENCNVYR